MMSNNSLDKNTKSDYDRKTPPEKLQITIEITAKCRHAASNRLERKSKFLFFIITILSLGLILIPLIQISDIKVAVHENLLSTMSLFLAITVLVYSVIVNTENYNIRAYKLMQCGDLLKELTRQIEIDKNNIEGINLMERYEKKYQDILKISENHEEIDYMESQLKLNYYYNLKPYSIKIKIFCRKFFSYCIPIFLVFLEVLFIAEILGKIKFFSIFFINN